MNEVKASSVAAMRAAGGPGWLGASVRAFGFMLQKKTLMQS